MSAAAIFLDKDGTVIEDEPFNVDPVRMHFTANAGAGLRLLQSAGYALIVVSNQPGLALGRFTSDALNGCLNALREKLRGEGVSLSDIYYCPHASSPRSCDCRKPAPGMLLRAAREHDVSLPESWLIGDILDDVEAGNRAGCRSVLLDVGNETVWRRGPFRAPTLQCRDLLDAAESILAVEKVARGNARMINRASR